MLNYEVCREIGDSIKVFHCSYPTMAAEKYAEWYCNYWAEYSDFDCYVRAEGERDWMKFSIYVSFQPVYKTTLINI